MEGFQSFRLTYPGANYQWLYAYSKNSCSKWFSGITASGEFDPDDGPNALVYQAIYDINTGKIVQVNAPCVEATNSDGGSNAMASWHN